MSNKDNKIVIFEKLNGNIELKFDKENETFWANQSQIAMLFDTTKQNVSLHIQNIIQNGEADNNSVIKDFLTTTSDGKNYSTKFYNLELIIAVGDRVNSQMAIKFRGWSSNILKEYTREGSTQNSSSIVIYQDEQGNIKLDVRFENETVWLPQKLIAEHYSSFAEYIQRSRIGYKFNF